MVARLEAPPPCTLSLLCSVPGGGWATLLPGRVGAGGGRSAPSASALRFFEREIIIKGKDKNFQTIHKYLMRERSFIFKRTYGPAPTAPFPSATSMAVPGAADCCCCCCCCCCGAPCVSAAPAPAPLVTTDTPNVSMMFLSRKVVWLEEDLN